jgi:DNA-binding CsgD family transcriptional regulator
MKRTSPDDPVAKVKLSRREAQVLFFISRGKANKEIAFRLQMSTGAVKNQVSRLCRGLGLSNRVELCIWGIQHPESLMQQWSEAALHPPGCLCQSVYCSAMRSARPKAA